MIKDYYEAYLGYEQGGWSYSDQRDRPLNFVYYYRLIATEMQGKIFYSVSKDIKNFQPANSIRETLALYKNKYKERLFYRMKLVNYKRIDRNDAVVWDRQLFDEKMASKPASLKDQLADKYQDIIESGRRFYVHDQERTAAIATVTDIDCGGGNIAVYTNESFRRKGYAKMVVSSCIEWCLKHDIEPIYLVDHDNTASIKLAESLGFETFSKEYVLSESLETDI